MESRTEQTIGVTHENFSKVVKSVFGDDTPTAQSKLRPQGQKKSSNNPYYREKFALELKAELDKLHGSTKDVMFFLLDFPELRRDSLYLKINQAFRYLIDNLDLNPPNKYRELRDCIIITRESGGVRISLKRDSSGRPLMAREVASKEEVLSWKDRMENFFEQSVPGDTFKQFGLSLNEEEINLIKQSTAELSSFITKVTHNSVEIIHVSGDI